MFDNFIFNNKSNKTYGLTCVKFDSSGGAETVSGGCETELITEKTPRGNKFHIVEQYYSAPMTFTFQIINIDGSPITPVKERTIKKWLCERGVYRLFQIDIEGFSGLYYNVNISNPKLINVINTVGMEFTVTTDSPSAYTGVKTKSFSITDSVKTANILIDGFDDYVYPTVNIIMGQAGILQIANSTEATNGVFELKNVSIGEVITIESGLPYISSSISTHDIFADFNKKWIRFKDGINTLTFNLNCTITITYREIREVGVF